MQENRNPPDYGYRFAPPTRPDDPGHPRLEVFLRPEPTYRHFDPELVQIKVVSPDGGAEVLRITHPWPGRASYPVVPDRIIMKDRIGKVEEAFTFGGDLQITSTEGYTISVVQSTAPILHLTNPQGVEMMLAEEMDVLMAELRAGWIGDQETLDERLAGVPPVQLYAAFLETLRHRMQHRPALQSESNLRFAQFVNHEVQRLRQAGLIQQQPVPVEQLLGR